LLGDLIERYVFDIQGVATIFKIRHGQGLRAASALFAGCASNSVLEELAGGAGRSGKYSGLFWPQADKPILNIIARMQGSWRIET
jgi:hypothetical protein